MAMESNLCTKGSGFLRKAAFVLNVIDDFENTPVKPGQVTVKLEDGRRPIQKADGYFVFMDLQPGKYRIHLSGPMYQPVWTELETDGRCCMVAAVRMLPGKAYPLSGGSCRITGNTAPGAFVRFIYTRAQGPLKLLYDYEDGTIIRIFSTMAAALDGRMLCISDNENPAECKRSAAGKEFFTIRQTLDTEERVYLMDRALSSSYKKGTAHISYTTQVQADEYGEFFMAVANSGDGKLKGILEIPGKEISQKVVELDGGQQLKVNLLPFGHAQS